MSQLILIDFTPTWVKEIWKTIEYMKLEINNNKLPALVWEIKINLLISVFWRIRGFVWSFSGAVNERRMYFETAFRTLAIFVAN